MYVCTKCTITITAKLIKYNCKGLTIYYYVVNIYNIVHAHLGVGTVLVGLLIFLIACIRLC